MSRPKGSKVVRINLEFTPEFKAIAEGVQKRTNSASFTETLRKAVVLLDAISKQTSAGDELILRSSDGQETKVIVVL